MNYVKSLAVALLLTVNLQFVLAKSIVPDSLQKLLQAHDVRTKSFDFWLSTEIIGKSDSLFIHQLNNQIQEAISSQNQSQIMLNHWQQANYYFVDARFDTAILHYDKALLLASHPADKAMILLKLSRIKYIQHFYLEALEYLRQAKITIYKEDFKEIESEIQLEEAICYTRLNNENTAESRLKTVQSWLEENENPELQTKMYSYWGWLFLKQKNYVNAQAFFLKALEGFKSDSLNPILGEVLQGIGCIYYKQNNLTESEKIWNEARALFEHLHNKPGKAFIDLKLASVPRSNPALTFVYLKEALHTFDNIADQQGLAKTYLEFANYYQQQNQADSAASSLKQATKLQHLQNDPELNFRIQLALMENYLYTKNLDSALLFMNKSRMFCEKSNDLELKTRTNNLYASILFATNNFREAYIYKSKALQWQDSLQKFINSFDLKLLQVELDSKRKQSLIDHLTQERNQQNQTLKENKKMLEKQKALLFMAGMALLFIVVVLFLLVFFLRQRKKDNRKLAVRNRQIAQQKEEIDVQRQHLVDINQELEKLSIVARETDNGIRIMNEAGSILWVNEGYEKMHGFNLGELQKMGTYDLLGENANININQLVNVWYGDKKPISFESLIKNKHKKEVWVQTTLTPILDEMGKISKMIAIDSDITRIKLAEQEIMTKNLDITSSISYAKRIQEAMMTPFSTLSQIFPESFCFYQPKSIVSGDFYWITYKHDRLIVACADSTGHGVPGAFMSLIGISFLNKIVNEKGFVSPAIILNRLRMNVISHLHQGNGQNLAGDGMDMSLISIDLKNNFMEYAGAMNPIIIIRDNDLIELKPDRMPVGFFDNEDRPFSSTHLNLKPNDQVYLFTDGYYDQFGGENDSKMKSQRFREILKSIAGKPANEQKEIIEARFNSWRGNNPQVDDVLIMGIHIN